MTDDTLKTALRSLRGSPHWPILVEHIKQRRDGWMNDAGDVAAIREHAVLSAVVARMDELNQLLATLEEPSNLDD